MATPARRQWTFFRVGSDFRWSLVLLHNYGHLDLHGFFRALVAAVDYLLGAVKLFERTAGRDLAGATEVALPAVKPVWC